MMRYILIKLAADRAIYQLRNQGAARRLLSEGSRQLAMDCAPGTLPCGHSLLIIIIIIVIILLLILLALVIFLILKIMGLSYFGVIISVNCCQLGIRVLNTCRLEMSGLAAANANRLLSIQVVIHPTSKIAYLPILDTAGAFPFTEAAAGDSGAGVTCRRVRRLYAGALEAEREAWVVGGGAGPAGPGAGAA